MRFSSACCSDSLPFKPEPKLRQPPRARIALSQNFARNPSELVLVEEQSNASKARRTIFSALWQADATKVPRCAPMDLVGRHMKGFFDYGIADEVHELKGDTAQGAALGTMASCAKRTIILTGTLNGGYADELFNILFRLHPKKMLEEGFAHGDAGVRHSRKPMGFSRKSQPSRQPTTPAQIRRRSLQEYGGALALHPCCSAGF